MRVTEEVGRWGIMRNECHLLYLVPAQPATWPVSLAKAEPPTFRLIVVRPAQSPTQGSFLV
jgi:hypothetical protein